MPMRLERMFTKLNRTNMKHRLYEIYKWQVGRSDANRREYADWLEDVAAWIEENKPEETEKTDETKAENKNTKSKTAETAKPAAKSAPEEEEK